MAAMFYIERNDFCNFHFRYCPDASQQVQSGVRFLKSCGLENFEMAPMLVILGIGKERF